MLKKVFILNLLYLFAVSFAFSYSDDVLRELELKKYGSSFEYESLSERLNRLETDYFGMSQAGDLDDRLRKLSQISNNYKSYPASYPYQTTEKKKSVMKGFWDNFSSLFDSGSITGFTPPMSIYQNNSAWENFYRPEYLNSLNNPQNYCPYHNRYQHNIPNRLNTTYPYRPYYLQFYNHPYMGNYPINRYYQPNYYSPPNIYTRTGVHIIND